MARDGKSDAEEIMVNGVSPTDGLSLNKYTIENGYLYYVGKDKDNYYSIYCLDLSQDISSMKTEEYHVNNKNATNILNLYVKDDILYYNYFHSDDTLYLAKRSTDFKNAQQVYAWELGSYKDAYINSMSCGFDSNGILKCVYTNKYDKTNGQCSIIRCDLVGDGKDNIGTVNANVLTTECDEYSFVRSYSRGIQYLYNGIITSLKDSR